MASHKRPLIFFIALISLNYFISAGIASANELKIEGIAKDIDDGHIVYRESFVMRLDANDTLLSATVRYYQPNNKKFAIKSLDYSDNPLIPHLTFNDLRNDSQTEVFNQGDNIVIRYRFGQEHESETINFPQDKPVVVDAGFERLINQNWQTLVSGQPIPFYFLAIDRAKLVEFTLSKLSYNGDFVVFQIKPDSFWVSLVIDPIKLVFDKNKRLVRFSGLTNIAMEEDGKVIDDHYEATILYQYP